MRDWVLLKKNTCGALVGAACFIMNFVCPCCFLGQRLYYMIHTGHEWHSGSAMPFFMFRPSVPAPESRYLGRNGFLQPHAYVKDL